MPKAGYCAECQAHVWVAEDGSCKNGHPAHSVSGIYHVKSDAQQPAAEKPVRHSHRSRWLIALGLTLAALTLLAACGAAGAFVKPLAERGAGVAGEWRTRLAREYPGWRVVGFDVRSFHNGGASESEYTFTAVPPGRDFTVGLIYVATDGHPAEPLDDILRPGGEQSNRADPLLDFLEANYADQGKAITGVLSENDGTVTVSWLRQKQFGPFSSRHGSADSLKFDEGSGRWRVIASPALRYEWAHPKGGSHAQDAPLRPFARHS